MTNIARRSLSAVKTLVCLVSCVCPRLTREQKKLSALLLNTKVYLMKITLFLGRFHWYHIFCFMFTGSGAKVVFVAVAGRSNGLGPVLSGNTTYPVINCPPVKADNVAQDVWSSLNVPSGMLISIVRLVDTVCSSLG